MICRSPLHKKVVQPVHGQPSGTVERNDRHDWKALIFVFYLSVAVSVPAPECFAVGHADYETDESTFPR